jgi:hypothetical protein
MKKLSPSDTSNDWLGDVTLNKLPKMPLTSLYLEKLRKQNVRLLTKISEISKGLSTGAGKTGYINGNIKLKLLKEDERPVKSLTNTQIKKLLPAFIPYQTMRM